MRAAFSALQVSLRWSNSLRATKDHVSSEFSLLLSFDGDFFLVSPRKEKEIPFLDWDQLEVSLKYPFSHYWISCPLVYRRRERLSALQNLSGFLGSTAWLRFHFLPNSTSGLNAFSDSRSRSASTVTASKLDIELSLA